MAKKLGGECFLAFDLGASSGRGVVGRFTDSGLAIAEAHRFPNRPLQVRGTMYWDALELFREIQEGIRRGAAEAGRTLAGIGIDTWGVDFGLLDEAGRLIGNPVHYRDVRNEGMMDKVFAVVPREQVFETTGIQFLPFNTLYQLAAMKMQGWSELSRARTLLMMPDLFNYFLCGVKVSEFTDATTTQFYDPRRRAWAIDLLAALHIPPEILAPIVAPGTVLGVLDGEAAREAGEVPLIAPACHDTGSAVAAVPVAAGLRPGSWAYLSSGTWSIVGIEVPEPLISPEAYALNVTNEGGVGGFRFLKNIAGLWFLQECQRVWSLEDRRACSFDELCQAADHAAPFQCFIDPDDPVFLRPEYMPAAIADFCRATGQKPPDNRAAMVRCILESLALKYEIVRRQIEKASGQRIEVLHVVGGGSQNDLLNRFTAQALSLPVLAGPVEATAIGNLIVQAVAQGVLPDLAAGRALIRQSFPLKSYEPGKREGWEEAKEKFQQLLARKFTQV